MPLPLWEEVLIGVALVPMLAATGIAALGLHEYSDDEDADSDTPQAYRQYPPTMTNTLLAPAAEKPINYRASALWAAFVGLVAFANIIGAEKRDRREARKLAALDDEQQLNLVFGMQTRQCLHIHCANGEHVYADEVPGAEDSAA